GVDRRRLSDPDGDALRGGDAEYPLPLTDDVDPEHVSGPDADVDPVGVQLAVARVVQPAGMADHLVLIAAQGSQHLEVEGPGAAWNGQLLTLPASGMTAPVSARSTPAPFSCVVSGVPVCPIVVGAPSAEPTGRATDATATTSTPHRTRAPCRSRTIPSASRRSISPRPRIQHRHGLRASSPLVERVPPNERAVSRTPLRGPPLQHRVSPPPLPLAQPFDARVRVGRRQNDLAFAPTRRSWRRTVSHAANSRSAGS